MPFCPFCSRAPLLKPHSRKKGTLILKELLRNLVNGSGSIRVFIRVVVYIGP